ncbi:MAG TPA: radical SAM protein [Chitinophagales bacterium]|nr:radical SAM protein [Chitinophagales bacterium]
MLIQGIILFNPRAASHKPRIPNSILAIAATIEGRFPYVIVDGNREDDPQAVIESYLASGIYNCFASTVMPGPQLKQAIPITRLVHNQYPHVVTIWGGYFASNQSTVVMESGIVDYTIYGPGDRAFPALLDAIQNKTSLHTIPNLIWRENGVITKNTKDHLYDQDTLPDLPYATLNRFYPISGYLGKTVLGKKTIAYHSSIGCPFSCAFCGIVPIFEARWKGQSAEKIVQQIRLLKNTYGGDAIEFHDNNFFVSEARTLEFSRLMRHENMHWWGEGRIDTINKYADSTLAAMRDSGCRMIFFGAETGDDAVLQFMDKGGTQTAEQIKQFAARLRTFDIIPEYSFVLGTPAATQAETKQRIIRDIAFIREIKRINPDTEIIIYVYSPVPTEGSELFTSVQQQGFAFPKTLDDWISPEWAEFDLRKNPLTPWLTPDMVDRIRNFETVLNGYYPTVSDVKLSAFKRSCIRAASAWRYHAKAYHWPLEIKFLQKYWLKYRQPEIEGF